MTWKSVDGDYSGTKAATWSTMIDGMLPKERLLDIIQNFVCFNDSSEKVVKIIAAYHQYFAVRKAIVRAEEAVNGDGKIGVFWHTQGSGKSLSMVFFAHLLQRYLESPTIVVITDRNDLDDQLFGQFSRCARFLRQKAVQAESRRNLQELLEGREANGIIFTTMQKFSDGAVVRPEQRCGDGGRGSPRPVRPDRTDQRGRSCVGRRGPCRAQGAAERVLYRFHRNADLHG